MLAFRTLYACKSGLCKAVLDGATSLATGEEDSTVTHRGRITPGPGKYNTKTFILQSLATSFCQKYFRSLLNITVLESGITVRDKLLSVLGEHISLPSEKPLNNFCCADSPQSSWDENIGSVIGIGRYLLVYIGLLEYR